jgi:hypothetical protein
MLRRSNWLTVCRAVGVMSLLLPTPLVAQQSCPDGAPGPCVRLRGSDGTVHMDVDGAGTNDAQKLGIVVTQLQPNKVKLYVGMENHAEGDGFCRRVSMVFRNAEGRALHVINDPGACVPPKSGKVPRREDNYMSDVPEGLAGRTAFMDVVATEVESGKVWGRFADFADAVKEWAPVVLAAFGGREAGNPYPTAGSAPPGSSTSK